MIHHQLLPLNQLQIPQLLLPHIRIPPKMNSSFAAHSMVFLFIKNVQRSDKRKGQAVPADDSGMAGRWQTNTVGPSRFGG